MKNTKKFMNKLTNLSSPFLLGFAILSFIILIVFKTDFYSTLWFSRWHIMVSGTMGFLIAFTGEGVRFALMLASSNDVKKGRKFRATLGFVGSAGMVGYDMYISWQSCVLWNENAEIHMGVMWFLIACGALLEVRLCMVYDGDEEEADQVSEKEDNKFDISKMSKEVQEAYFLSELAKLEKKEKK